MLSCSLIPFEYLASSAASCLLVSSSGVVISAANTFFKAIFSSWPSGFDELDRDRNEDRMEGGIRAFSSGVWTRKDAISGRGRNPHSAWKGVIARAISGL